LTLAGRTAGLAGVMLSVRFVGLAKGMAAARSINVLTVDDIHAILRIMKNILHSLDLERAAESPYDASGRFLRHHEAA
jgi:hypothetical protein